MRQPIIVGLIVLGILALAVQPGSHGQLPNVKAVQVSPPKQRDLAKLTVQQRHFYLSGQRGMEWLQRANKPDGRFIHGFLPALRVPMEGDSYVRQAGAVFALARTARFYGDDRSAAIAKQALLTLLLETSVDPKAPHVRNVPIHQANPLVAAGTIIAAIHELPAPAADLLDQADQLANLLRQQIQADGSLNVAEAGDDAAGSLNADSRHTEALQHYPGTALYAIIRSHRLRPAAWKVEALRKAQAHYSAYWQQHKNMPMLAWQSGAYTEAYLLTKEPSFAAAVFVVGTVKTRWAEGA